MHSRNILLALSILLSLGLRAQDTTQKIIGDRTNAKEQVAKPYVILISSDGFRFDLASKWSAEDLLKFREQGVSADYMLPSFPSLTTMMLSPE